jgi:hypothetical protein
LQQYTGQETNHKYGQELDGPDMVVAHYPGIIADGEHEHDGQEDASFFTVHFR